MLDSAANPDPRTLPGPTPTGYQRTQGGGLKWLPPTPEQLGRLLPQYDVQLLLGRGGMGAVYKGFQRNLDRPVAIKILPAEVVNEDPSYVERFKIEARIMARLDHPAIVPVHDFGETSEGQLYFVMGFIDGTDIHQMIRSHGRLPPEYALAITAHVCDALGYAHSHGVVHRDIKPSNILINQEGQVKVADFGLAKAQEHFESPGLTKTGLAMGTPDYVAPEALVMGMTVDGRADLFAIGVMLYQMLTGHVPRGAWKPASVEIPGIDPRFDSIVAKATQYDREERYPAAQDLRRDLDVILTTPLVTSGGQSSAAIPQAAMTIAAQVNEGDKANAPDVGPAGVAPGRHPTSRSTGKVPLIIGLGTAAAVAAGAFMVMRGKHDPGDPVVSRSASSTPVLQGVPSSSNPHKVANDPKLPGKFFPSITGSSTATSAVGPEKSPIRAFSLGSATKDEPFVNSLGMEFVPVAGTKVLFSVWDTRVQDYAVYAAANPQTDGSWRNQRKDGVPVAQERDHPVVGVSWEEAQAFCRWLTERENSAGILPNGARYRLPTDAEWSTAAGLESESGTTPQEKSRNTRMDFLWGREWPPPKGSGNFADETFHSQFQSKSKGKGGKGENAWIQGYDDGYATTSPVGSFPANRFGLYDMAGNVWQWCEDRFDPSRRSYVLRGAAWNYADRVLIRSSFRHQVLITERLSQNGFRCVLEPAPGNDHAVAGTSLEDVKYPPGRWVALFSKFEDLPEDLRMNKFKLEDGWITPGKAAPVKLPVRPKWKNIAVRYQARVKKRLIAEPQLRIQRSSAYSSSSYQLKVAGNTLELNYVDTSNKPRLEEQLASTSIPGSDLPELSAHQIVFGVVGQRLVGRMDSTSVTHAGDSRLVTGEATIYIQAPIREIEVINLDGLPDTEALKILGVDEGGKDLLALQQAVAQGNVTLNRTESTSMTSPGKVAPATSAEANASSMTPAVGEKAGKADTLASEEVMDKAESDPIAAIPELKALHEQFAKLQVERVTSPFVQELAALNSSYLGGLDRAIADEKKAGHLDGVLALEGEKKLIQSMREVVSRVGDTERPSYPCPLPPDGDQTTATLKTLRKIYRDAFAGLERKRQENLQQLVVSLIARLKQIETALTRQDRIDQARVVRDYQERVVAAAAMPEADASAQASSTPGRSGPDSAKSVIAGARPVKVDPKVSRDVAELVLRKGGAVRLEGSTDDVVAIGSLPKGTFKLQSITFSTEAFSKVTDAEFLAMTGAAEVREFRVNAKAEGTVPLAITTLEPVRRWTRLETFQLDASFNGASAPGTMLQGLSGMTTLDSLILRGFKFDEVAARSIASLTGLTLLRLQSGSISDDVLRPLGVLKMLATFEVQGGSSLTNAALAPLAGCSKLERLLLGDPGSLDGTGLAALGNEAGKSLHSFTIISLNEAQTTSVVEQASRHFPDLRELVIRGPVAATALQQSSSLRSLRTLLLGVPNLGREHVAALAACKGVSSLVITLGDLSADDLKPLTKMRELRSLAIGTDIYRNGHTDMKLSDEHLKSLASLPQLRNLTVPKAAFTPEAVNRFRKALPGCTLKLND